MRSILEFGAQPNTELDHAPILEAALKECSCLFLPRGTYYFSRPILLSNQSLYGEGPGHTILLSTDRDVNAAVIRVNRRCQLDGLGIGFDDGIITGEETTAQRVGLYTGWDGRMFSWGSTVHNIRIFNCGTGIYSSDIDNSVSFSVTYDTMDICNFSYRGVDFTARIRTGNVFRNLYIYSKTFDVDTLFSLDTEESETTITQLNLEQAYCKYALRLRGVRAGAITSLHVENVFVKNPEGALIYIENSSVAIEALSVYYGGVMHPGTKLIELGDAVYDIEYDWADYFPENLGYLRIGTLHLKGLNDPGMPKRSDWPNRGLHVPGVENFLFFSRRPGAKGEFRVQVDQYVWYTFQGEGALYEAMACDGEITFLKKGQLPVSGPTANRPVHRLCPYYTTYFDTDLMQLLIWTGQEWKGVTGNGCSKNC